MPLVALFLSAAAPEIAACPLPAGWGTTDTPQIESRPTNMVSIERGSLTWNNVPIDESTLETFLLATRQISPQPRLIVDTGSIDCATISRIVTMVQKASLPCTTETCVTADVRMINPLPPPAPPMPRERR